jgi:hypothetical protein
MWTVNRVIQIPADTRRRQFLYTFIKASFTEPNKFQGKAANGD